MNPYRRCPFRFGLMLALTLAGFVPAHAQKLEVVEVEGQPLAANVTRLLEALDFMGAPLPADTTATLRKMIDARDAKKIQELLDPHVLVAISINPESRVKVARGPAPAVLPQ